MKNPFKPKPAPAVVVPQKKTDPLRVAQSLGGNVRSQFKAYALDLTDANSFATIADVEAQESIDAALERQTVARREVEANTALLAGLKNLGVV